MVILVDKYHSNECYYAQCHSTEAIQFNFILPNVIFMKDTLVNVSLVNAARLHATAPCLDYFSFFCESSDEATPIFPETKF
jgi:hypothetical protein